MHVHVLCINKNTFVKIFKKCKGASGKIIQSMWMTTNWHLENFYKGFCETSLASILEFLSFNLDNLS